MFGCILFGGQKKMKMPFNNISPDNLTVIAFYLPTLQQFGDS